MVRFPFYVLTLMAILIIEENEVSSVGDYGARVNVDLTVDVNGKRVIDVSKPDKNSNLPGPFPAMRALRRQSK